MMITARYSLAMAALFAAFSGAAAEIFHTPRIPALSEKITFRCDDNADTFRIINNQGKVIAEIKNDAVWQATDSGFYTVEAYKNSQKIAEKVMPVTWHRLHLLSWTNPQHCRYVGTEVFIRGDLKRDEWKMRGSRCLGMIYLRPGHLFGKSDQEVIDYFLSRARKIKAEGYDGFGIDELGVYPTAEGYNFVRQCALAFQKIREEMPEMTVINWTGGPLLPEEIRAALDAGQIFTAEFYPEFAAEYFGAFPFQERLRVWIDKLRNFDALYDRNSQTGSIIALGIGGNCGITDPAVVEERIRIYKRLAPEAPGICYYYGNTEGTDAVEYSTFLDQMSEKYFIKPVLNLYSEDLLIPPELQAGKKHKFKVLVRNIGGMKAENVKVQVILHHLDGTEITRLPEVHIARIGNGIAVNTEPPFDTRERFEKVDGTLYPRSVDSGRKKKTIFTDRTAAEFEWKVTRKGYYRVSCRIIPDDDRYTVLDGVTEKVVYVK